MQIPTRAGLSKTRSPLTAQRKKDAPHNGEAPIGNGPVTMRGRPTHIGILPTIARKSKPEHTECSERHKLTASWQQAGSRLAVQGGYLMTDQDWISLKDLGTHGGMVLAVTVIAQFIKGDLDRIRKVPTRYIVLLIAWGLLAVRRAITEGFTSGGLFLDFINGFFVALAAMGTHQIAKENISAFRAFRKR